MKPKKSDAPPKRAPLAHRIATIRRKRTYLFFFLSFLSFFFFFLSLSLPLSFLAILDSLHWAILPVFAIPTDPIQQIYSEKECRQLRENAAMPVTVCGKLVIPRHHRQVHLEI